MRQKDHNKSLIRGNYYVVGQKKALHEKKERFKEKGKVHFLR